MERGLDLQDLYILTHPLRFKIVRVLIEAGRPMFIAEIAKAVDASHRLISFHLATMLRFGFVESEWGESPTSHSKGKAVKYYKLTSKVYETYSRYVDFDRVRRILRPP